MSSKSGLVFFMELDFAFSLKTIDYEPDFTLQLEPLKFQDNYAFIHYAYFAIASLHFPILDLKMHSICNENKISSSINDINQISQRYKLLPNLLLKFYKNDLQQLQDRSISSIPKIYDFIDSMYKTPLWHLEEVSEPEEMKAKISNLLTAKFSYFIFRELIFHSKGIDFSKLIKSITVSYGEFKHIFQMTYALCYIDSTPSLLLFTRTSDMIIMQNSSITLRRFGDFGDKMCTVLLSSYYDTSSLSIEYITQLSYQTVTIPKQVQSIPTSTNSIDYNSISLPDYVKYIFENKFDDDYWYTRVSLWARVFSLYIELNNSTTIEKLHEILAASLYALPVTEDNTYLFTEQLKILIGLKIFYSSKPTYVECINNLIGTVVQDPDTLQRMDVDLETPIASLNLGSINVLQTIPPLVAFSRFLKTYEHLSKVLPQISLQTITADCIREHYIVEQSTLHGKYVNY